jgi:small GTP-binding protein
MLQKKIVMLGSFAVGKTSLVRNFVHSTFSEKYHTTIGVKVDRKQVDLDAGPVDLVLWDIHGDDEFQRVRGSYLRGASGYLLVVDGTRPETLQAAQRLYDFAVESLGDVPFILLINKNDLQDQWQLPPDVLHELAECHWHILHTSAKTGKNVENAFNWLAQEIVRRE